tara:strand:+ start:508 stop:963 length:456 start_codon:yes stop_codon:yes gene_type:complete
MRDAKTVGFSIGTDDVEQSKSGISKKLSIFDISMQQYYNYTISDTIFNEKECYVFVVKVKQNLNNRDREKTLIRKIVSYFDKENFNIIYRHYKFVYNHLLIDLDMDVVVHMHYVNEKHVPTYIHYKGFWNALFFKPERADFKLKNTNYFVE